MRLPWHIRTFCMLLALPTMCDLLRTVQRTLAAPSRADGHLPCPFPHLLPALPGPQAAAPEPAPEPAPASPTEATSTSPGTVAPPHGNNITINGDVSITSSKVNWGYIF